MPKDCILSVVPEIPDSQARRREVSLSPVSPFCWKGEKEEPDSAPKSPLGSCIGVSSTCMSTQAYRHTPKTSYAVFYLGLYYYCVHAKSLQSCLTLCDPMDYSLPGSPVHGIPQARILEWVAMPTSRGSSRPRDRTCISYVSCIGGRVLYHQAPPGRPYY